MQTLLRLKRRLRHAYSDLRLIASGGKGLPVRLGGEAYFLLPECADGVDPAHEEPKYRLVLEEARPGMTVFDLGAHHGLYTLGLARRVGPTGRVVAFEPCPVNHRLVTRNVELNGFSPWVRVEPCAVSDRSGTAEIRFDEADFQSGNLRPAGEASPRRAQVPVTTLDAWCAEHDVYPQLVKVDVEGLELEVLRGADRLLRVRGPVLHVEFHAYWLPEPEAVVEFCLERGYQVMDEEGRPLPRERWRDAGHLLFRRQA